MLLYWARKRNDIAIQKNDTTSSSFQEKQFYYYIFRSVFFAIWLFPSFHSYTVILKILFSSAIGIFALGAVLAITLCAWCGITAYVAWVTSGCDKGATPLVDDRMLPSFVTYIAETQNLPGLSGVFLAGVFGAGLR